MSPQSEYLRVRVWADEPPANRGYTFIAMRRFGNDNIHAGVVSVNARGDLLGWRWQAQPTHWLPMLPFPGRKAVSP